MPLRGRTALCRPAGQSQGYQHQTDEEWRGHPEPRSKKIEPELDGCRTQSSHSIQASEP
jgi:hypothetical protein